MPNTISAHPGTAIVTGASSGIGKIYAERLAARGYDIVLVARREERLRAIAADLRSRFAIQADALVADLSEPSGVVTVRDRIAADDVSLLINNAGFSALKALTETPDEVITRMVALNVTALTLLSKAALVAFKARGSGTLVNIGSGAGFAPYPGIPVYGATKAYVYLFTQSLQSEVADTNLRVQLVLPGAVVSEGWEVAGGGALEALPESIVMTTEDCVEAALNGLDRGECVTAPSLQDEAMLRAHETDTAALLQAMFDARPAQRYKLGG
ncbi:SDR family NAD(P)-dependent oxidoreductase [Pseudoroseomonas wenyumeiae]|uniref:NADP-dependent 3-hydroxy acid dehydrogenase YdfG n=1 Tax=Teichococcus wenyumeiae TaxID=2478470 RepID=A0A3A9JBD3_9PROT|nr:SDR family oxidoreductase [Pseudoroseomonas wenyumeiae]RKK03430.1 SDR family oxidoreductase [Pseudoroseomonas wenyumeiae]RMI25127.1 SDR family NAD(P)-dependent oxidoreductase [Pseudoroseomonas wenyumeiae]